MAKQSTQTDTKNVEKLLDSVNKISKKEVSVTVKRDNSILKKIVRSHGDYIQMFSATVFEYMVQFHLSRNDMLVLLFQLRAFSIYN